MDFFSLVGNLLAQTNTMFIVRISVRHNGAARTRGRVGEFLWKKSSYQLQM